MIDQAPSFGYPVILDLTGKPCLVVGGGHVAMRKVTSLLKAGALVTLVAPEILADITKMASDGRLTLIHREYLPEDLDGQIFAFGALDDPKAREALSREARSRGIPVNLADDPQNCDFIIPSSFSRGDLLITVSTNGTSPAMSRKLRQVLEKKIGPSFALQVEAMGKIRKRVMKELPDHESIRRDVLLGIVDSDLLDVLRHGDEKTFRQRVDKMITEAVERAKKQ